MKKKPVKTILFYSIQTVGMALVMGYIIYTCAFRILINNLEESLTEVAKQGATAVEVYIDSRIKELHAISLNSIIRNSSLPMETRLKELERQLEVGALKRISIADTQGKAQTTDGKEVEIGDREYYQKALAGVPNVSDPVISRVDGTMAIAFAVPIYEGERITGVLYGTHDADVLSKMTDKIRLGPQGNSFIINQSGDTIAHDDRRLVYDRDNNFVNYQRDASLEKLVALERQMVQGKTGAGDYIYHGIEKYMGFSPIHNTTWSLAVSAPKSQVLEKVNQVLWLILFSVGLISIIITIISIYSGYLKRRLFREQVISNRMIDIADIIIFSLDRTGKIITSNRFGKALLDKFKEDSQDKIDSIFDLLPGDEGIKLKEIFDQGRFDKSFELTLNWGQKDPIHLLCTISRDGVKANGADQYWDFTGMDITERVVAQNRLQSSYEELTAANEEITATYEELAASEEELRQQFDELMITQQRLLESDERYHLAVEGSNDAIWDWSFKDNRVYYSDKFYEMVGFSKEEIDNDISTLYHPDDIGIVIEANQSHLMGYSPFIRYELRMCTKNDGYKWFLVRGKAIIDERGQAIRIAGSITDINETKIHEGMIHRLAYFDALTGLPNRTMLYEETEKAIQDGIEYNLTGALIFIDLDNFKYINDSCGHSVGDLLLIEVGKKLSDRINDNGLVFRLGGDEFIILIKDFCEMNQLEKCLNHIMDVFNKPFHASGNNFYVLASCGVALFPDNGQSVDALLKNADMAMYHAKKNGKHKSVIFNQTMSDRLIEKVNMENGLRDALENKEFILNYQPQLDLVTGRIYGFEALIRWISPQYGSLMPLQFIDSAEESGLIIPIGKWVLHTACRFIKSLHDRGYSELKIAVNISAIQLMQTDFFEIVLNALKESALAPSYLELELTESTLMEMVGENIGKLKKLQALGVTISIDDFGKGYSSLSYLKVLPVDKLKIDKSFIDEIGSNKDFTAYIVQIGHQMGLSVVAEGVESKEQLDLLLKIRCNFAQGYLFGIPVSEEDAFRLIEEQTTDNIC